MTEAELLKLAEATCAQRLVVEHLDMINQPWDTKERIRLDAMSMVARDKLFASEAAYRNALRLYVNSTETSYSQLDKKVGNDGEKP